MSMLETKANFKRKETEIEATNCVIEKVIRLSGTEFDRFSRDLMNDWDFIRDNPIERSYDTEGRCHCLLVMGNGRPDGILINSEGSSYARYNALLPNAEAFLFMNQYPVLSDLNKKLTAMVDYIAEQGGAGNSEGRGVVDLQDDGLSAGIDFMANPALRSALTAMLDQRPEIRDWELDGGQLIVWRNLGDKVDLTDPSVTPADMYAYGYTWDGMIPLGEKRALELFDKGYAIFRLSKNDAEGMIDSREEILAYDGLFGTEDPAWERPARIQPLQAFVMNSEKYNNGNGEAVGEWLTLPADADTLQGLLERIGVERASEVDLNAGIQSAFTITALRLPIEDELREYVSVHDSLDELNMLASFIDDMEDYELDKLQAILITHIADLSMGDDISAVVNLLYENNFTAFDFIYAHNEDALGRWYADANGKDEIPEGVSFEEHGRNYVKEEGGKFVPTLDGYIKHMHKAVSQEYGGIVPAEYKIVEAALRCLQSKTPELGSGEKPSVLDEINASRKSKTRAASKAKNWDVKKERKNKGGQDL